jgi:hypothetical protein
MYHKWHVVSDMHLHAQLSKESRKTLKICKNYCKIRVTSDVGITFLFLFIFFMCVRFYLNGHDLVAEGSERVCSQQEWGSV